MYTTLVLEGILFVYFSASVLYTLTLAIAGRFYQAKKLNSSSHFNKIALLVPSYKEDDVIKSVAKHLADLDYPKDRFDVVIIADSLHRETLDYLSTLPIITLEVQFEKSTKTRSLNEALKRLQGDYDIAVINDADNLVQRDFLRKINDAYNSGCQIIQAQRVAKNLNTPFAILDAISEIINNHLYRKGASALGLSSSIIGSGMAYPYTLLKDELSKIDAIGGFDKILQLNILEKGYTISYIESILIFDEKIESSEVFKKQRKRWLSSHFIYARQFFLKGIKQLFKANFNYFNLSVLYNIFPPRLLMIMLLTLIPLVLTIVFYPSTLFASRWGTLLLLYLISMAIAIPKGFYTKETFKAFLYAPVALLRTLQALVKLKGADKTFIHTKHRHVEIDEKILGKSKIN